LNVSATYPYIDDTTARDFDAGASPATCRSAAASTRSIHVPLAELTTNRGLPRSRNPRSAAATSCRASPKPAPDAHAPTTPQRRRPRADDRLARPLQPQHEAQVRRGRVGNALGEEHRVRRGQPLANDLAVIVRAVVRRPVRGAQDRRASLGKRGDVGNGGVLE